MKVRNFGMDYRKGMYVGKLIVNIENEEEAFEVKAITKKNGKKAAMLKNIITEIPCWEFCKDIINVSER